MTGWFRKTWARCRASFVGNRLDREFDQELDTHLELLVDEGRRRGLSDVDARREALRKLGRPLALREIHREQRGIHALDVVSQDLRYALRMLWKSPAFAVIVAVSLALGVGANTAPFSLVDDLLLRSLPVPAPERLFEVHQVATGMGLKKAGNSFSPPAFEHIRAHSGVVSEVVGFSALDRPVIAIDGAIETPRQVVLVSSNFFRDLGVTPAVGRVPEPSDAAAVILSDGLWRSRFGGSTSVLGRAMTIAGRPCTIVGVAPAKFRGLSVERGVDLWIASRAETPQQMIVRLRPGVTSARAQAEMQALFAALGKQQPDVLNWDAHLTVELLPAGKGLSQLRAQYQRPLLALTVLVALVFLMTCVSIGLFGVASSTVAQRTNELGIRMALGAGRWSVVRESLGETILVFVAGMGTGILAAFVAVRMTAGFISELLFGLTPADVGNMAGAAILMLVVAVAACILPSYRATRIDPLAAIRHE